MYTNRNGVYGYILINKYLLGVKLLYLNTCFFYIVEIRRCFTVFKKELYDKFNFIEEGNSFHIFGPKNLIDFRP